MADGDRVHLVGIAVANEADEILANGTRWMRRADVRRCCGVGKDVLDGWVCEGLVEAHKLHPGKNGTVIFSAADIERTIKDAPLYIPEKKQKNSHCVM